MKSVVLYKKKDLRVEDRIEDKEGLSEVKVAIKKEVFVALICIILIVVDLGTFDYVNQ